MTKLIFVRHGESEGNNSGRFNGHSNFTLTDKGRQQAKKTAEYLKNIKIDKVYASDLLRAYETAEIIAAEQNLEPIPCEELREIFGGDFESKIYSSLKDLYPVEFDVWINDLGNCRCPNGESIRELLERFNNKVKEIATENKGKTVLIGTHAMPIRVMTTLWHKKDITAVSEYDFVKNASVTIVDYTDIENPKILEYNIADHIGELITELPKGI